MNRLSDPRPRSLNLAEDLFALLAVRLIDLQFGNKSFLLFSALGVLDFRLEFGFLPFQFFEDAFERVFLLFVLFLSKAFRRDLKIAFVFMGTPLPLKLALVPFCPREWRRPLHPIGR